MLYKDYDHPVNITPRNPALPVEGEFTNIDDWFDTKVNTKDNNMWWYYWKAFLDTIPDLSKAEKVYTPTERNTTLLRLNYLDRALELYIRNLFQTANYCSMPSAYSNEMMIAAFNLTFFDVFPDMGITSMDKIKESVWTGKCVLTDNELSVLDSYMYKQLQNCMNIQYNAIGVISDERVSYFKHRYSMDNTDEFDPLKFYQSFFEAIRYPLDTHTTRLMAYLKARASKSNDVTLISYRARAQDILNEAMRNILDDESGKYEIALAIMRSVVDGTVKPDDINKDDAMLLSETIYDAINEQLHITGNAVRQAYDPTIRGNSKIF